MPPPSPGRRPDEQAATRNQKTRHAARACRARARAPPRLRQYADLSRLDHPVSHRWRRSKPTIRNSPMAGSARRRSRRSTRRSPSSRAGTRTLLTPSGLSAIATTLARPSLGGRPCARLRQRLSADAPLLRQCAEAARRRDHLLRSADRRRHREAHQAQHQGRLHRVAGLADLRGAGHSGHRRSGACGRRRGRVWTTPGRRRSTSSPSPMAPTCRSRRRPNISSAMPTPCSAPSPRTKPSGRRSHAPMTSLASVPGLRTSISACAACAASACGLRGIRPRASSWRDWLAQRPEVARVIHPALPSDPGHAIWKRDFTGSSGLFPSC